MRKLCYILVLALVVMCFIPFVTPVQASSVHTSDTVYLDNGDYIVTSLVIMDANRATYTIGATKVINYHSSNGDTLWTITLKGNFSYNPGVFSVCNFATCEVDIYDTSWVCEEKSAYADGNRAVVTAKMVDKFLFVAINTQTVNRSMTCDTYGNIT